MARITSVHNPKIKEVVKLNKRSFRDRQRLTAVEGGRELGLALAAGVLPSHVFVCDQLVDDTSRHVVRTCYDLAREGRARLDEVSSDVYARMAYRGSTGGIVALMPYIDRKLDDIACVYATLGLIVEGAEKPGNLGALLRTADAAGVDFVIVCGDGTDIHNPNTVRASLGAVFTVPIVQTSSARAISWLHKHEFRVVAASPGAHRSYASADLTGPAAIVVGSEAHGLGDIWLEAADILVCIPMSGSVDSLNLSASAAILLYEAVRQREALRSSVSSCR